MSTPLAQKPVRVLSVDDSAFFRRILVEILGHDPEIELVRCAADAYEARDTMLATPVDVMTLDLEMPRMDGLTFLKLIMEQKPMPVIVLSSLTPTGSKKAVEALIAGACAVIQKPADSSGKLEFAQQLLQIIKRVSGASLRARRPISLTRSLQLKKTAAATFDPRRIIALGASTGGTQALEEVLTSLPAHLPGIVVVQHIPADFSAAFAERLNRACTMEVREARDGDEIHPGLALIAPGNQHLTVHWRRDHYRVQLHAGAPVHHQRPSVDVLFESLANSAGPHAVAALLTGMGKDGAAGMKMLHDLDAYTIGQDAESSVVYGMARHAVELKAVRAVVSLENVAGEIMKALEMPISRVGLSYAE